MLVFEHFECGKDFYMGKHGIVRLRPYGWLRKFPCAEDLLEAQFPAPFIERFAEKVLVHCDGNVHFIDHRVFVRIVSAPENRF